MAGRSSVTNQGRSAAWLESRSERRPLFLTFPTRPWNQFLAEMNHQSEAPPRTIRNTIGV